MDYNVLVLELLELGKYPVLEKYVVIDIYYKMIPINYSNESVKGYDRRLMNPQDIYIRDAEPFDIHYLVSTTQHNFHVYHCNALDTSQFPIECLPIKLTRSFLDKTVLYSQSVSFEEEIYHFLTLLNYDVSRLSPVLNLNFAASTRFLPQRVKLWVFNYLEYPVVQQPLSQNEKSCFGPTEESVPVRVFLGRLAECTSRSTLLSLNNHLEFPKFNYLHHFTEKWKTIVPLAFNPLENPIIIDHS